MANIDVTQVVAEIQAEVERKKAAGAYPPELIEQLNRPLSAAQADPPEVYALIQTSRPLHSRHPVLGPAVVFCKRLVRRLLAWYIDPVAKDQTNFNAAMIREFRKLEQRVEELEEKLGRSR